MVWVKGLKEEGLEQSAAASVISMHKRLIHIGSWQTSNHFCLQRTGANASKRYIKRVEVKPVEAVYAAE